MKENNSLKNDNIDFIIDSTIEAIMIVENGFIINVNKSFLKILEYENKNEVIGNLASGCILPFNKEKFIEYNKETFQEISLLTKNGNVIPSIIKISNYVNSNDNIVVVNILDLTDFKNKEKLLITQSKLAAMGEALSMIAHQWKQPLNSIASTLTNIKLKIIKKSNTNEILEKVDDINSYLQYMGSTVDEFKEFINPNKSKQQCNIKDIIKSSLQLLKSTIKSKNIAISVENIETPSLMLNKNELIQVFLNILNNAIDAFVINDIKEPLIKFYFKIKKNNFEVYIEDNARGLDEEIIDKIFDPYFTTKEKLNGTGLGLYMCKVIIENNYKGSIKLLNKNQGCCCKISFDL